MCGIKHLRTGCSITSWPQERHYVCLLDSQGPQAGQAKLNRKYYGDLSRLNQHKCEAPLLCLEVLLGRFIGYLSIAMIRYHDQGKLQKKEFGGWAWAGNLKTQKSSPQVI